MTKKFDVGELREMLLDSLSDETLFRLWRDNLGYYRECMTEDLLLHGWECTPAWEVNEQLEEMAEAEPNNQVVKHVLPLLKLLESAEGDNGQ